MNKHTPGPWEWVRLKDGSTEVQGATGKSPVAILAYYPDDRLMANACLIAAVPELLAACEATLLNRSRLDADIVQYIEFAIAKATGK